MIGRVLKSYRLHNELDLRTVSKQIGISAASLMRIEHGHSFEAATLMKILNWLTTPEAR